MATRAATLVVANTGVAVATWTGITEADTGAPVMMAQYPDRTVQVTGDFTTSGAITMQGSNDGTNWASLHNAAGDAVVITDTTLWLIAENPLYIRPTATAGTAVNMTVIVVGAPR